ncbi:U-box domain-containing protein 35-like [Zingiber officinale]|uniref:U-box domain-containing protein 35-like n=1 Tax=Zingiber officinale TaxID=94328 RepID=UPI001C4CE2DB|nr:U-box domain-containing protein 35-like [Zingiber officinale]XP_042399137.1 U-box domain-containing protein 35-like [Zingiber officinale]XP_042399138.1 U-box domain-containing protein 35-like [Zingiber officinale]XP_042399139.1 U-box domain-containing protein 35-like [Zingiber officinale]XP_042399140.1 U-box domain-containing protein 35-like [Zingiber officinale]XP_042399141.1 U-box domain-containing protein 35-like [Zingiber officinale]
MEASNQMQHKTTVAVAISRTRNSNYALQWALKNFMSEDGIMFKLLHVVPAIKMVPTPMGNRLPIEQVRDDVVAAYRKEEEWRAQDMLRPYKKMCTERKIEAEVVVLEGDDAVEAIARDITESSINRLVIGASTRNPLMRKFKGGNLSSRIAQCTPLFCTIYVVSKGKLSSVRRSISGIDETQSLPVMEDRIKESNDSAVVSCSFSSISSSKSDSDAEAIISPLDSLGQLQENLNSISKGSDIPSLVPLPAADVSPFGESRISTFNISVSQCTSSVGSLRSYRTDKSWNFDMSSTSCNSRECMASGNEGDIHGKLERLEKETLACASDPYLKYTWEEIVAATSSFSEANMVGVGANGKVYRGSFHHTVAAIKVLHSDAGYSVKQFKQELKVLPRVRHPHVILLLGACPDKGCLVYEYMENGSLEDRLQCKNSSIPIPWFSRFRIAWEVASALVFLHNSKPEPIIHRDLKPANILLDNNFVSKIGDAGLSTLLPTMPSLSLSTIHKDTAPVGTFFYMDPEYQRTGLVSPKSDTYALGMVILQLLTAKPPVGLTLLIETALENDSLMEVLDSKAGWWLEEEVKELANLGLSCLELRSKDRPNLKEQVLPVLERLKDRAEQARYSVHELSVPPNHFICPLMKAVMDDPCIASDGYTYNRSAIEIWLSKKDKSPITNLPFLHKDITPNNSLLSAIRDWKSRKNDTIIAPS